MRETAISTNFEDRVESKPWVRTSRGGGTSSVPAEEAKFEQQQGIEGVSGGGGATEKG